MEKFTGEWHRTHTCGEPNGSLVGEKVVLNGWVHTWRNHGGVVFINLRDRYGIVQLVFTPERAQLYEDAQQLRHEYVIAVAGTVRGRPADMVNKSMATGEIEIEVERCAICNRAETPPIHVNSAAPEESEEMRLRWRVLDLRRPSMQQALILKHTVMQHVRRYLSYNDFIEIETPILMKSTPEGARDFLVPSRLNRGKFYALPQSPQLFKQILMAAGFDRYFQIARCFRDEDLRTDRQPEFTQIDAELSFVDEEDIFRYCEGMFKHVFKQCLGIEIETPFPRFTYDEVFRRYGSDKPDLRFDMPIEELTDLFSSCEFKVFRSVIEQGGHIAGIAVAGGSDFSRKQIDELTRLVSVYGAKGLIWARVREGDIESPTKKFFSSDEIHGCIERCGASTGDMIFIVADQRDICFPALGQLRLETARRKGLISPESRRFLWVYNFPLFEYSEEQQRYLSMHHPFTAPHQEDIGLLQSDQFYRARARAYDLVLNGSEIGGGSIRIHDRDLQNTMFSLLGIGEQEAEKKFGFLLTALSYGAPPHGGIAFGLDRIAMLMAEKESIREVIAFPKTSAGLSLMDNAPDRVSEQQLRELGIKSDMHCT
jgi:aspartyl-tRNA synthetase